MSMQNFGNFIKNFGGNKPKEPNIIDNNIIINNINPNIIDNNINPNIIDNNIIINNINPNRFNNIINPKIIDNNINPNIIHNPIINNTINPNVSAGLTVRKLPVPPEAPEEPDMNAVYLNAYEGKVDDLIKLLAKAAGSKDGAKIIKRLPGFDGKNNIKELQKNPEAFIKSFLKNEEDLEELLETIQDSKLGDKLMTLLEKTPAGQTLFKEIAENIENELSEYNEAMLQYEDALTAYETALDDFINPAFLLKQDEEAIDEIIAQAEAEAEAELSIEEVEGAAADALAEAEEEEEITAEEELLLTEEEEVVEDEEIITGEEAITDEEIIAEEEIVTEEEVLIDGEVATEEEITQG